MNISSFLIGYQAGKKIAGGGGSSADVRYVTFMSYDGSIEYGKKAVAVGDDCADPIARGVFDKPTRESTAQHDFDQNGWANTPNGEADANWYKNITEDKTVYASFQATVRCYTITYYDEDGTTVLKTESLAYGAVPSYTPEKDGYSFDGWSPTLVTVTGNASYTAVWIEKVTFAGGSWADIIAISESREAKNYFAVGDTKTVDVDGTAATMRVIGFDHDNLFDGSGKAGMTIYCETLLPHTTTPGHFAVRNFLETTIKPLLPAELQSGIKSVTKEYDSTSTVGATQEPSTTRFDLFPLSFDECGIKAHGARRATDADWRNYFTELGTIYEYFEKKYHSTYCGPYNAWDTKNGWLRQYARFNTTNCYLYSKLNISFASGDYTLIYADITNNAGTYPVRFAFCI